MKPSSSPAKPRLSFRQRLFHRTTIIAVLIVLLAAGGYWTWHKFYGKKDVRETYLVEKVERGDIQDVVTATGTVQPLEFVDVGAQVSGQLKKLHIEVGSVVKEGDLLAEIDPTVFLATVDARRAGLRNQLATMKDRQAQLTLAQLQYERQKNLLGAEATTAEALQTAEATLRSSKAQIDALQAQIEQTQSTLRADEANLNYAKIYAPMNGTVVSLTARQGQTLNANQSAPTILRIADLSTMTVQAQVGEAEVGKLAKGMEVYFTTLGSQGRRWYGALRKIEPTPTVTNNVVLYNALFDVSNRNQALLPSMTTQVFFIAATAKDALLVPTAAVTLTRGTGNAGGKRNRDNAADAAGAPAGKGDKQAPASGVAAGDSKAVDSKATETKASDTKTRTEKSGTPANKDDGAKKDDRFATMSSEERRAAFEKMTPEEREAFRERRRAMREAEGKSGDQNGSPKAAQRDAQGKDNKEAKEKSGKGRDAQIDAQPKTPPASDKDQMPAQVSGGFTDQTNARQPRRGTVKVIDKDGKIEQRKVELGVTNRVQMQILSGLSEGDEVIVGLKLPPPAKRSQNPAQGQQQPGGIGQGGNQGGQAGRAR
jgi:macrolide-specific efflux system membrane fusion protein